MNDVKSLLIRLLSSEFNNKYGFIGRVKSISGNNAVVEDILTGAIYQKIRLQAANGTDGILVTPTDESIVIVGRTSDVSGYIAMYSDIDTIQFLDGSFGGLVKINDLVTKLNNLENKVNDLIIYINAHVHPSAGVPPSPLYTGGSLTTTNVSEIENTDITHGT